MKQRGSALAAAIVGVALCLAVTQMTGEHFSAVALLVAALSCYYLGARFYSAFLAGPVLELDDDRPTPAHRLRDDQDFLPYRRWTLFGMHFAWIAGPGPLIGPTLAAQFGYLPGFIWIVLGAVLMGCVQDMVVLTFSVRRDGMSLATMIKREISPYGGFLALFLILFILEIILGVLALFVVNALRGSPWGTFTIAASIPIAFLVGWYMTRLRPGAEGQATALGVALLIGATAAGGWVADQPGLADVFTLTSTQLAVAVVIYGFLASSLPAWMLLAPRDNISAYLKVGVVALLAAGIVIAQPQVVMPAVTPFIDGSGPIFGGAVFPFCFIVIACGAISGFHSLIASGTTPRFLDKESDIRYVAYGGMLTESFVGVMALIAAVTLAPGVYLAMNIPAPPGANADGTLPVAVAAQLTGKISAYGPAYRIDMEQMDRLAEGVRERSLYNRSGGAPSLAVGMSHIFSRALGGGWLAFWYHFAIMFEAVFILTVLDSGTRVIRFVFHDLLKDLAAWRRREEEPHVSVWATSLLAVVGWGLILSWGILDPEGGTRALIKLFGTANQMLGVVALALSTVMLLRHRPHFAWVTGVPALVVAAVTLTAAVQAIFSPDPRVGALAAAADAASRAQAGALPAARAAVLTNNAWLTAALTSVLLLCVCAVLALAAWRLARLTRRPDGEAA